MCLDGGRRSGVLQAASRDVSVKRCNQPIKVSDRDEPVSLVLPALQSPNENESKGAPIGDPKTSRSVHQIEVALSQSSLDRSVRYDCQETKKILLPYSEHLYEA